MKIERALEAAIRSVGGEDFSQVPDMIDRVMVLVEEKSEGIPDVEMIQDAVEEILIKD